MAKQPCVYIMTNRRRGTLYVGVTSSLLHRAWQHKGGMIEGFTKKYRLHRLVYFEFHATFSDAILREKALKRWRRDWKIGLIESVNPTWRDLFGGLTE
ncbi:MAG: GIY-YIG nuclease family protein [Lysobacterales bacterium]